MDSIASCIVNLREEIAGLIHYPSVLDRLCPHIIPPDDAAYIRRMYRRSPQQATHTMLDLLLISPVPGKWTAFNHALAEAEYPYLAKLIKTNETPKLEHKHQKKILEIFSPYLERQLNPVNIVPALYAARVINNEDKDKIMTVYNRIGATAASMVLLQLIQQRLDPELWYHQFLKILFECGHEDLAKMLEPDFHPNADFKCPPVNMMFNTDDKVDKEIPVDDLKTNLKYFKYVFKDLLRVPKIVNFLVPVVLSPDKKGELLSMDKVNPGMAADMLVYYILETNNLKDVLDALYVADYPYLADLLSNGGAFNQYYSMFRNRIHIFFPYICERVDSSAIIPHLYAFRVINHVDREEVLGLKNHHSSRVATGHLLECMQCRQTPKLWYTQFLKALEKNGQRDLADLIEPEFCSDPELWTRKVDENFDIDNLLFNGNIQISDEPNGDSLDIHEEIRELAAHEESVLKSAAYIRLELAAKVEEWRKSEQRLLTEVLSQQKVIVDQIKNKRTALLNRCKQNTNQPRQVDLHAEREQMECSKLKTNDNKLATLIMKKTRSLSSVSGTIYSNVVLDNGEDLPDQVSPTALPGINTRERDVYDDETDQEPHSKDETETSSESSVPSSGYLIVKGMERLEVEKPSENVVSALIHNRSIQISEHRKGCVFSDIKILPNGEIVVCDSTHACIMLLDRDFYFKDQLKLDGQPLHIGTIFNNRLAVHLENTSNIILCHAQLKDNKILQWVCQSDMCTLCTNGGTNIYTLCEGKHMHVFKLDDQKCDDYSFSAIQKNNWWPRFMAVDEHSFALDDSATTIYLTERNTNSLFCFYLRHRRLTFQWKYEGAGFLSLSGIVCCFDRIIVADSDNYILLELDKKGNYKTDHEGLVRPYALAVSEKEIFVTRANTGRDDLSKTVQCYTIQFNPQAV